MGRYAPASMMAQCKYSALPEWLEERPPADISPGAKICFSRLLRYAWSNGYAFPPIKTLAAKIGVSDRQARRYIRSLEKLKLIEVEYQDGEPCKFYLSDEADWFPKEADIIIVSSSPKAPKSTPKKIKKVPTKLSTTLDTSVKGGHDTSVKGSRHICHDPLDTSVKGSRHICHDSNKQFNKQINKQTTNARSRSRAKGGDFDLFENAGLNSQDENLHFSQCMTTYPKNPHHRNLYAIQKLWVERRIDGFSAEELEEGVKKYRAYCDGKNITGKKGVMSLCRFFGDELNFKNAWDDELEKLNQENNPYSHLDFPKHQR